MIYSHFLVIDILESLEINAAAAIINEVITVIISKRLSTGLSFQTNILSEICQDNFSNKRN